MARPGTQEDSAHGTAATAVSEQELDGDLRGAACGLEAVKNQGLQDKAGEGKGGKNDINSWMQRSTSYARGLWLLCSCGLDGARVPHVQRLRPSPYAQHLILIWLQSLS